MANWWLLPEFTNSNLLAAWNAAGALNGTDALINRANPGTYNLVNGMLAPDWNVVTGWTMTNPLKFVRATIPMNYGYSMLIKFSNITLDGVTKSITWRTSAPNAYQISTDAGGGGSQKFIALCGSASTPYTSHPLNHGIVALTLDGLWTNGVLGALFTSSPALADGARDQLFGGAVMSIQAIAIYTLVLTRDQILSLGFQMPPALPTIEEAIFAYLSNNSFVTDLVSTRIYPVKFPQTTTMPCIVYQRIDTPRSYTHDDGGALGAFATPRFQFEAWSTTYAEGKRISDTIRNALNHFKGELGYSSVVVTVSDIAAQNETVEYSPEFELYRFQNDFIIYLEE